ncbi:helix-turn-helix domain-containing protein [Hymenobacter sp. CRA2]|nr:helix-turn-helix domain-containing protein [Hymenobacter sp. CRA2]
MAHPDEKRQLALKLYLEGMGLRAIGRVLDVSNVTVMRWVRT